MAGRMYLGNQMVTPVIVQGDSGIKRPFPLVIENGNAKLDWLLKGNEFDGIVAITEEAEQTEYFIGGLESICSNYWEGSFVFNDLEIVGEQGLASACTGSNITSASFPKLKTVGIAGFEKTFSYARRIVIESFPELETVGDYGFFLGFEFTKYMVNFSMPKLKTAGESSFEYCFRESNIQHVYFAALNTLDYTAFRRCFTDCPRLKDVYFNSLNANSFGNYKNQFEDMLSGCSGVTIHFPAGLDATIGSWSDVLAGFGGTNTTILYDL